MRWDRSREFTRRRVASFLFGPCYFALQFRVISLQFLHPNFSNSKYKNYCWYQGLQLWFKHSYQKIKILDGARVWTWLGYMKVAVSIDSVSSVILQYLYQFWDVKLNKQSFRFEIHKYMILYNMYYISQLTFNPFLLLCKILHNSRSNLPSYYCFPWL